MKDQTWVNSPKSPIRIDTLPPDQFHIDPRLAIIFTSISISIL